MLRSGSAGGAGVGAGGAGFCSTDPLKRNEWRQIQQRREKTLPVQVDFHDGFLIRIDGDRLLVLETRRATGRRSCAVLRMIGKEIVDLFAVAHLIVRSQRKYLPFDFRLKKRNPSSSPQVCFPFGMYSHRSSLRRKRNDCCRPREASARADERFDRHTLEEKRVANVSRSRSVGALTIDLPEVGFEDTRETRRVDVILHSQHRSHHLEEIRLARLRPI